MANGRKLLGYTRIKVEFLYLHFICMGFLPACISVYPILTVPKEVRRECPGTGVIGGYDLSCGYWEMILHPLREPAGALNSGVVSSLQSPKWDF